MSEDSDASIRRYREILEDLLARHSEMSPVELAERIAEVFKLGQDAGDDPVATLAVEALAIPGAG